MLNAKGMCIITMLHRGLEASPVGKNEMTHTVVYSTRIEACPALFPFHLVVREQMGEELEAHTYYPLSALKVKAKSKKVNGYHEGTLQSLPFLAVA